MQFLNVGCGPHYAEQWVNTDLFQDEITKPDIVVSPDNPYPFSDNYFDAIYMGHILEHMPWNDVDKFIKDMMRIAAPGAPILIVGPDTKSAIDLYADGDMTWEMLEAIIEHQHFNFQDGRQNQHWDGASHFWNCSGERICMLLEDIGIKEYKPATQEMLKYPHVDGWYDFDNYIVWPVVAKVNWQFGILFKNNK